MILKEIGDEAYSFRICNNTEYIVDGEKMYSLQDIDKKIQRQVRSAVNDGVLIGAVISVVLLIVGKFYG